MLREESGTEIRGLVSVAKHLARNSNHTELLGRWSVYVPAFIILVCIFLSLVHLINRLIETSSRLLLVQLD